MKRLAIITTHPVQYYAPVFRLLAERGSIAIMVFYTWGEAVKDKYDPGFQKKITWDIPVLEGYPYQWAHNIAQDPGTHHFNGIITPELKQQVMEWKPDAVLFYGWSWKSHLRLMRTLHGKMPVFFRGDSTLLKEQHWLLGGLRYFFLRWVYAHVDRAFFVGKHNKAYFRRFGLNESKLTFAPHAIDNERFGHENPQQSHAWRARLGIPAPDILVLYAGKFETVKNLPFLIEAFREIKKDGVHLWLVGNGPLEKTLKAQASGCDHIHFMNFQNQHQMPAVYQACDLFCLPSASETWGLGVNEAMACGKAVLVSERVGCAPDLVSPGQNGEIFRHGDKADFQQKFLHLAESREALREMGQQSLSIIRNWSFEAIAAIFEQTMDDLNITNGSR